MTVDLTRPSTYAAALAALTFIFLAGYGAGTLAAKIAEALGA